MDFGESFGGFQTEDGGLRDRETENLGSWKTQNSYRDKAEHPM
jgi:hypothetical protein